MNGVTTWKSTSLEEGASRFGELLDRYDEEVSAHAPKAALYSPPIQAKIATSRAMRLAEALAPVDGVCEELIAISERVRASAPDDIKDEKKQDDAWKKAKEAATNIESFKDELESAMEEVGSVEFPGMFG
jgi:hypothetical protein